jgi:hypothetical protein
MVRYVLSVVFFQAWPAALFFATVKFFPFSLNNPLDIVGQPVLYISTWTLMGMGIGLFNWHHRKKKFGTWVSDSSEIAHP